MKHKAMVLQRYPNAQAVVASRWYDGTPRHVDIRSDDRIMDIHSINQVQGFTAAWRSAWFWIVRNSRSA